MLENEPLIDLAAAAAVIEGRTGQKPHLATVHRWCTRGCRGVKLESMTAGHKRFTSEGAVRRFMLAAPPEPVVLTGERSAPNEPAITTRRDPGAVAELEKRIFGGKRRSNPARCPK